MSELAPFVFDALKAGKTREEVSRVLQTAGWPADEVKDALGHYADVDFPVPVPRRSPHVSARDAFLHLVAFSALYISAIGLGTLVFQLIDLWLPDPVRRSELYPPALFSTLRWAAASLIVSFPIYLGMNAALQRTYRKHPDQRTSPVRRWLTYLTLFLAVTLVISYLIGLLADALGGELAASFAAKVTTVALIAGTIFTYYLSGLRQDTTEE